VSQLVLPRVYPITDVGLSGLPHSEQVALLAAGGANFVQLREKRLSPLEFFKQARLAIATARERGLTIIINDRADIAFAAGAAGVHLGQDDLPPEAARRVLGQDAIIGYSTHSVEQAREAALMPIDYLAIGPIFTTSSKQNPDPVVGLAGLSRVREAVGDIHLVAIGGITLENAAEVIKAGADTVAVLGTLAGSSDSMTARTAALIERLSRL
jgi:thiamine-phosphate diphosphorylase